MATQLQEPHLLRQHFRAGNGFKSHTNGACGGHLQANMAMMESSVAEKFYEFCVKNSAPCPLIYKSQIGEVGSALLGKDIDIRTDLAAYRIFRDGQPDGVVADLKDIAWDDVVSFYLGCSFSFDDKLLEAGIELDQSQNIPMYVTNIDCIAVPPFATKMVVTMRPMQRQQLELAVNCTLNCDYAHGAPIHIGVPHEIGISDLTDALMGEVKALQEDEIPVFWACGVTSTYAIKSAHLRECYSHSPGSMFVADVLSDDVPKFINTQRYPKSTVIPMNDSKTAFTIASQNAIDVLKKIEVELMEDPGQRKIDTLLIADDYVKACLSIANNGHNIVIILGFPCFEEEPLEENDGVAGAIYMAKALITLGKKVTFIVDSCSVSLKKLLQDTVPSSIVTCIGQDYTKESNFLFDEQTGCPLYSHLIAIERPSPGTDGHYHRFTTKNILTCDPTHLLFEQAQGKITTIGIGDGGNELGMGKVHQNVVANVPNGAIVASTITCDYLITCGVSNWGGFGVAAGLYVLSKCSVFDRYRRFGLGSYTEMEFDEMIYSKEKDEELGVIIRDQGFRDGANGQWGLTVDNLDYYKVHVVKYDKLRELAKLFSSEQ